MEKDTWFGELANRHPVWLGIIVLVLVIIIAGLFIPDESTDTSKIETELNEPVTSTYNEEEIIETKTPEEINNLYKVTRVIDGDTIELSTGERVRLICIDTPEKSEEGYSEATDYLESLILNKNIELIKDISETDRYDRLLRYIYLEDGTFVNERIVYYGYGKAYPYNPDTSLCPEIQEAEQYAKDNKLGIWKGTIEEPVEESSSSSNVVCSSDYYNCGDFSSCLAVMEVFNACSSDIHGLDGDDDGIPCESLCG